MDEVTQYRDRYHALTQTVWAALNAEVDRLGFPTGTVAVGLPGAAEYTLERDPASGQDSLVGVWRDAHGHQCGTLLIHADGSFFAEYDVIRGHPRNDRWFVEAVTAWGRGGLIRAEPRLLPVTI